MAPPPSEPSCPFAPTPLSPFPPSPLTRRGGLPGRGSLHAAPRRPRAAGAAPRATPPPEPRAGRAGGGPGARLASGARAPAGRATRTRGPAARLRGGLGAVRGCGGRRRDCGDCRRHSRDFAFRPAQCLPARLPCLTCELWAVQGQGQRSAVPTVSSTSLTCQLRVLQRQVGQKYPQCVVVLRLHKLNRLRAGSPAGQGGQSSRSQAPPRVGARWLQG